MNECDGVRCPCFLLGCRFRERCRGLLTHFLLAEKAGEQLGNRHAHFGKVISLDREG